MSELEQKDPSGMPEAQPEAATPERAPEGVAYETHKKLLGEKKRLQELQAQTQRRLEELETANKEREELSLQEQNEWKTLAERRQEELDGYKQKFETIEQQRTAAKKVDAFLKACKGEIDSKYWGLIDTDTIIVNPDTKEVDEMSVAKAVESYTKQFPETIRIPGMTPGVPTQAPSGGEASITLEEWKKLPAKEMKEKLHLVMNRKD